MAPAAENGKCRALGPELQEPHAASTIPSQKWRRNKHPAPPDTPSLGLSNRVMKCLPTLCCQSTRDFLQDSRSPLGLSVLGVAQTRLWSPCSPRLHSSGFLQGSLSEQPISLKQWLTPTSPGPPILSLCSHFFLALQSCYVLVGLSTHPFLSTSPDSKGRGLVCPFHCRIPSALHSPWHTVGAQEIIVE